MVSEFCPQLTSLSQLQRLAKYTTHNGESSMPVPPCLLSLTQPTSLCSFKLSCNSVPSRNMTGLTRLGCSKDFLVILCSLHSRAKVKVLITQSCPDSLWLHGNVAHQVPLSMEFSKQEYWNGLPFLSPADLPNPGVEPGSPALQVDSLLSEPPGKSQNIKVYPIHPVLLTNAIILSLTQTRAAAFQVFPPASTSFHVSSLHSNRRSLLITVQKTTVLRVSSCDSKERNWPKTVLKELPGQLLVFSRRKQPERRYLNSPSDKVEFSFQPQFFLHWTHL